MKKISLLCIITAVLVSISSSANNNKKDELIALNLITVKNFINDFKKEIAVADVKIKKFKAISDYNNKYVFTSLPDEVALFEKDTLLKQKRERWHEELQKDIYVEETLNVISDMKLLTKGKGLPQKLSMN